MNQTIINTICSYFTTDCEKNDTVCQWETPLIGFADAADPLFQELKTIVGPTHALPRDFLEDAAGVIAFFLPFDRSIVKSNIPDEYSSKLWARAYVETNALIESINHHLHRWFRDQGYASSIIPPTHNFDKTRLISDWSHRHVAYIAGMGRFGLNNMLITEKGCCGRFGTIVTNCPTVANPRPNQEYCLYRHNGTCAKCVERCPAEALTTKGYDRHKCYDMCLINDNRHHDLPLTDVCGKCLTGVPCSFQNPVKITE